MKTFSMSGNGNTYKSQVLDSSLQTENIEDETDISEVNILRHFRHRRYRHFNGHQTCAKIFGF